MRKYVLIVIVVILEFVVGGCCTKKGCRKYTQEEALQLKVILRKGGSFYLDIIVLENNFRVDSVRLPASSGIKVVTINSYNLHRQVENYSYLLIHNDVIIDTIKSIKYDSEKYVYKCNECWLRKDEFVETYIAKNITLVTSNNVVKYGHELNYE